MTTTPDAVLQRRLQTEVEKMQSVQKDLQKHLAIRQQLDGQLNENNMVKDEMMRLEDEANIYKMVGPVLVKQDGNEAKHTVQKRIEYISGELKRHEDTIKDLEKRADVHRESLSKLKHQIQQAQVKAAAKA